MKPDVFLTFKRKFHLLVVGSSIAFWLLTHEDDVGSIVSKSILDATKGQNISAIDTDTSGLWHCNKNRKVPGSKPTRRLTGLRDPTSLRGSQ